MLMYIVKGHTDEISNFVCVCPLRERERERERERVRECVRVCVRARVCVDQINFKCAALWHIQIYLSVHFVLCQCIMFEEVKLTRIILYT